MVPKLAPLSLIPEHMSDFHRLIAERTKTFDSSGIRRKFELAEKLKDPVNLSIGQPDFDVPADVQESCINAIRAGRNGYTMTQGITPLRDALMSRIRMEYADQDRKVMVTSGTSGALQLAILSVVNPGDEVILFDPYFVMYKPLVTLVGGQPVVIDTYPSFHIDVDRVAASITAKTKVILVNSPANPTGYVAGKAALRDLVQLADKHGILLISDEIYRSFCYDQEFVSPARFHPDVLVIDGFSKSHGMTGWRLGFAHGPEAIIETMSKLQQFTYVCAPHPVQWSGIAALECDMRPFVEAYRRKRDRLVAGLAGDYDFVRPGGAFYLFLRVPQGTDLEFVTAAVEQNLLIVPGSIFSERNSHVRISYAAPDETIDRGIEILLRMRT